MSDLRIGLGGQKSRKGSLPELGLTLHELGELIRRAGRTVGLIVESEYPVRPAGGGKVTKFDWVWLAPESLAPIVAIEVEGHGVYPDSVAADVAKFRGCGAPINVIALFQVDHNRTLKPRPPHGITPHAWVQQHAGDFCVEVTLDTRGRDWQDDASMHDMQFVAARPHEFVGVMQRGGDIR